MDLRELIRSRRTVHNYTRTAVADDLVEEALRLSLWAPNHGMTRPWRYTWLGAEARVRLGDLNVEIKSAQAPISEIKARAARENVTTPSHLISLGRRVQMKSGVAHEDYATLACSVQIASLFLWQHGVATKWSTGEWTMHSKTYEILDVNPKEVVLEGCLMIGHAAGGLPTATERGDLSAFLKRVP